MLETTRMQIRDRSVRALYTEANWRENVAKEYREMGQHRHAREWCEQAKGLRDRADSLLRLEDELDAITGAGDE